MSQREKALRKTRELAAEYQGTLLGCGHCSFAATIDALRPVGIELVDERLERGCMAEQKCTIAMAARWGTGYIFELMENPLTLEKVKEKYGEVR